MSKHLRVIVTLTGVLLAVIAAAAQTAPFSLEEVMSAPFPSNLVAARMGARVAWVFNAKGVRNVWIADGPKFDNARALTHYSEDGVPLAALVLTPDGRVALYARGSETNRKGEVAVPDSSVKQPHQQVWAVDIDGKSEPLLLGTMECDDEGCEDLQVSSDGKSVVWAARKKLWIAPVSGSEQAKELFYGRGEQEQPKWSPDGKRIAFTSRRGDHSFVGVYEFGKDTITWLAPAVDRDSMPRWSPDGKQVALIRQPGRERGQALIPVRPKPWAIWIADAATGAGRELWHSGTALADSFPRMTADQSFLWAGDRLVFAGEQDGWAHLYSIPVSGGKPTLLTPGNFEIEDVTLTQDMKTVVYSSNQDDIDRRHIWRIDLGKSDAVPTALTSGKTVEWNPVATGNGKSVLCLGSDATSPGMPYVITAKGRQMLAVDALPKDFPSPQLIEPKQVIFKAEDGWEIHGQLFEPKTPGKHPGIVFIHGGSMRQMVLGWHYMYYYSNAYALNQYLATLGYTVLSVNYRTGIMYGRAFREPSDGGWRGAAEYKDIVAAGRFLQSLPTVDTQKIGLWGGSYGGYLTAMGLARNSDLFQAGVDLHGVHDWSVFLPQWEEMIGENGAGVAPDLKQANERAFKASPNSSIANWKSPVLVIQGDDDRNVPFSQTVDLVQRLRAQDVRVEQLVFPDELHDFLQWRSWVRAYQASADFFQRELN